MGYLYVFAGLFANLTKGFCGKKMSSYVKKPKDAMLANTIRMFICIVTGFVIVFLGGETTSLCVDYRILLITALSGVSNAANVVSWVFAVKRGAYMLTDVFCTIGIIIPLVLGAVFFEETVKFIQWIGFAILIVAVMTMCSYNNSVKTKLTIGSLGLLALNGASNGFVLFSQKLFVKYAPDASITVFNFYTYLFAAVTLGICYLIFGTKRNEVEEKFELKSVVLYVVIMAICLFASAYFMTSAAQYLDSAQLYPVMTGASLVASSVMAAIFFKERIKIKSVIGIALTFTSMIIINVL